VSSSSHYCGLRGKSLVWLIGAAMMMCLLAAPACTASPTFVSAGNADGDIIRCGITGSCQSAATLTSVQTFIFFTFTEVQVSKDRQMDVRTDEQNA